MSTIALIGAPGSGKSRLAHALQKRFTASEPQCDQCPPGAVIVDDYAIDVRDAGNYEIGLNGGYMADISIAVERYNNERRVANYEPKNTIVCGTIIETAVYLAQYFERTLALKQTDEEKFQEAKRFEGCTFMLAVLYMDTFKYDKVFYLPPLAQPEDNRWLTFERNLQAAFQAYGAPVVPLIIEEFKDEDDLVAQQVERVLE